MQITSGAFKGRMIKTPQQGITRPTQSRVRAAIFNSLQHSIVGAVFLDICAGSGAMGLEALSRGAAHAIFIEQNNKAAQVIKHNIALLHVEDKTELMACDALHALKRLDEEKKTVDIIYFDPPYAQELTYEVIRAIDSMQYLFSRGGYFVVEERRGMVLAELTLQNLVLYKTKSYGDTTLLIFISKLLL